MTGRTPTPPPTPLVPAGDDRSLNCPLKSRHLTIIPIGDAVSTSLFVTSDAAISSADPGGTPLAYGLTGSMVWLIMQSLGEMITFPPVSGPFGEYGHRFISPSSGLVMGWSYWLDWVITVAAELAAAAPIMKYWFPYIFSILWSGLSLLVLFGINALSMKAYGEPEFWFTTIKTLTVIAFSILSLAMILGVTGEAPGTQNWTAGEAPFVDDAEDVSLVILVAEYSFQGTGLISVATGETGDPGCTVPHAIRTIFWRILPFYVNAIIVVGLPIPYTNPSLPNSSEMNIPVGPFTLIFDKVGILAAASLMSAVILTLIPSTGTSSLYILTRVFFALAKKGHAPRSLKKLSKHQVPVNAFLAATLVGLTGFTTSLIGDGKTYEFFLAISVLAGFIIWADISWSHYRFRKAPAIQDISLDSLLYRARFFPADAIVTLVACVLIVVGRSYNPLGDGVLLGELLLPLIEIPSFLALWARHKSVTREPAVDLMTAGLGRG